MSRFPITMQDLDKDSWNKKINATLMYSFQAEAETLPYLEEFVELFDRVHRLPLEETLQGQGVVAYFFEECFPVVCLKLINSKYFRDELVLHQSNKILELAVDIYQKYLHLTATLPKFSQLLTVVFEPDVQYFKHNNQLDYKPYPWLYYGTTQDNSFLDSLAVGDLIDAIKYESGFKKATWTRGTLTEVTEDYVTVKYLNDLKFLQRDFARDSIQIAPLGTMSKDFEWRMLLKEGDTLDCCDNYGGWYSGTVVKTRKKQNGMYVKVTFKIFDPTGDRYQRGQAYFGLTDSYDSDEIDVTSPEIQILGTVAKFREYSFSKSHSDFINDQNDHVVHEIKGERICAIPRNKFCSGTLFKISRKYIKEGGFDRMLELLEQKANPDLLANFLSPIGEISPMLNRTYVKELVVRIRPIVQKNFIDESDATIKGITKEKSEIIFLAMKNLLKRVQSTEQAKEYEVQIKLKLADLCLKTQSLKRRLQGLSEVKDILKSVRTHLPHKLSVVGKWLKDNQIFEKIYVQNSHAQLIKKSTEYFKFLITQSLLDVQQLRLIYKDAQKGDFQTRLSVYKLFDQVSHTFKKPHVDYLIDQILDSEIGLVATEDLDLLHQLSRYSTYFPLQKVVAFLERILFAENPNSQLLDVAVKRYSQIVVKNNEMIAHRKQTIKMLVEKLLQDKIEVSCRVLTTILDNVGSGQFGRVQILQRLSELKIDSVVLQAIQRIKDSPKYLVILERLLNLLANAVHNSQRIKLNMETFTKFWDQLVKNSKSPRQKQIYYKWCSAVVKTQNVFEEGGEAKLEEFFLKLTSRVELQSLEETSFHAISIMFININLKSGNLTQPTVWKNGKEEKTVRLVVPMKQLKFYDTLFDLIYEVESPKVAHLSLQFYSNLYSSQQISVEDRREYTSKIVKDFFDFAESRELHKIPRALQILNLIIDQSEKGGPAPLRPLAVFKRGDKLTFDVVNQNAYMCDNNKSFQVKIDSNSTLFELRKSIAKTLALSWQEVKLSQKDEILDMYNSKLMKDINLKTSESIKVCKKYNSQLQEQLTVNGKLNPKAVKVLESVFKKYSSDGRMSRDQCHPFTKACLGDASEKVYEQRIQGLFNKYDDDRDNFLTLANFMSFYEDAARDRPSTVWGNLKNFRFRYDFKSMDDPESDFLDVQTLPRYQLSFNAAFYQALFSLLKEEESVAKPTWNLLQRMPVSRTLYQELMNSTNYQILDIESPYKTLYCLYIFQYLLQNQHQEPLQIQWKDRFINEQGYEKLFKLYTKLLENDHKMDPVEVEISQFILSLTSQFIVTVFKTDNSIKSHEILKSNLGFDDLIVYIASGQLPSDKTKLAKFASIVDAQSQVFKFKDHQWKGNSNEEMTQYMIESINKLWKMTENSKIRDHMLEDSLSILSVLILEQKNCDQFLKVVPELISTAPSHALLIKLYLVLACICFYGKIDQQPVINTFLDFLKISEQSKKHLPIERSASKNDHVKSNLISEEYFRMLIVLIQAFGLTNMSQQTKDILLNNILTSRDEQIIQASALVLSQLQLQGIQKDTFLNIWTKCLFGDSISCKKLQTREAVYKLVLSMGSYNQAYTRQLTSMVQDTLGESVGKLKTMTQSQLKSRSIFNYAGLKNLGAVCYMLAMLQQLYMNPTFRHLLLRVDDHKEPNMSIHNGREYDDNLLHQIQKLFAYLEGTDRGDYNPIDFCYSCKGYDKQPINVCIQQDTQEFIFMILDQLESALNVTPFKRIISDMYKGVIVNLFTCSECNQTKRKQQLFFSLPLQVKNSKTLTESFDKFTNGQVINQYRCDFCNKEADVSKKIMIEKLPRVLIVNLKRIVFNLDIEMNEKISSKLQFPFELDMSSYVYNKPVQQTDNTDVETRNAQETTQPTTSTEPNTPVVQGQTQTNEQQKGTNNMYDLVGVVVHNGGAQYGHYYSFIKTQNQQWLQFNDSVVKMFDVKNLQQECFGGTADTIDDEFDWAIKKQNSKNAYLLIYQRREHTPIYLVYRDDYQKETLLEQLRLRQEPTRMSQQDIIKLQEEEPTFSSRKMSKEITKDEEKKEVPEQILSIQEPVQPYMFQHHSQKIMADNLLHQFEVNVWSSVFIRFYSKFLQLDIPSQKMDGIIQLTLKLVMGIWLKQPALKQLLSSLEKAVKKNANAGQIIISNEAVVSVLLESSDSDLRSCMESLLLTTVGGLIETNQLQLNNQNTLDSKVVKFLDHLFGLIPTTVSKNWMKFNQYFGFWKGFSVQGKVQGEYMMNKHMISHFLDFFLDKKSPLGIYSNKKFQLGNRSSNIFPNFTSLLDAVLNLVQVAMLQTPVRLTDNDNRILMDFDFLDKLFLDNNVLGGNLVKAMCRRNLVASEKVAIVLIKGFLKCNYENIQPLLEVAQNYIAIKDEFQQYRVKWVLGSPRLLISVIDKSISCYNTHSFEDRLYSFDTTIQIDQSQSILEGLYKNSSRMANYCMLTLKSLLLMCLQDQSIKDYVWNLPPPVVSSAHYHDFFQQFIESYVKDGIKMNSNTFPKVELGQTVMQLYRKIVSGDKYIDQHVEKHADKPQLEEQRDKQQIQSCDSVKGMDNNSETKEEILHQQMWMADDRQDDAGKDVSDLFVAQGAQLYATDDIAFIDSEEDCRHQENKDQVRLDKIDINDQVSQPISGDTNCDPQIHEDVLKIRPHQTSTPIPSTPIPLTEDSETNNQGNTEQELRLTQDKSNDLPPQTEEQDGVYTPVQFKYHQTSMQTFMGLQIHHHNSELIYLKTQPSLKKNDSFLNINKKLMDRISPQAWKTAISKPYNGVFIVNVSKESCRYKWKFGTGFLKAGDSAFVDTLQILDVWKFDKDEWPRWTLSK